MGTWYNTDGLYLKYGTSRADNEIAGEYQSPGSMRVIEMELDLTTLTSSAAVISDTLFFPATMFIEEVQITARVAAVGASATLDVGLIKADRSTELDYNGLIAAMPTTSIDSAGERTTLTATTTYAGALIGTATTDVGAYLTANYNTAAFTAGKVRIRIRYYGYGTISN